MANLMFWFCFLLGPAPFFVASLFCFVAKRKSGWGICGSFLVALFVLFVLVMICQSFWTTRVLYFTASHRLRNCKDRA